MLFVWAGAIFDRFDGDGDGYHSLEESQAMATALNTQPPVTVCDFEPHLFQHHSRRFIFQHLCISRASKIFLGTLDLQAGSYAGLCKELGAGKSVNQSSI